jgi:hypothetical protein
MKKIILLIALIGVTVNLCASNLETATDLQKSSNNKISFFILQQATHATAINREDNCYDLTLSGLTPEILYFADQPSQLVGKMSTHELMSLWKAEKVMHNTSIHAHYDIKGIDKTLNFVVALAKPQYNAANDTLQYTACINDQKAQKITLPKHLSTLTLFIDPFCANLSGIC